VGEKVKAEGGEGRGEREEGEYCVYLRYCCRRSPFSSRRFVLRPVQTNGRSPLTLPSASLRLSAAPQLYGFFGDE